MGEFADNQPDLKPLHDAKSLCEEFARIKGFKLKLIRLPSSDKWFVRIRYGKYCLKYFDSLRQRCEKKAWEVFAEQLCNPDMWFNPRNFKGWSHFGKCSCTEELAMRMAIYGDSKI